MRKALLLCVVLAAAAAVANGQDLLGCPPGLFGGGCNACSNDYACAALLDMEGAWCFNTTFYQSETEKKSYACDTDGTDWQDSITDVWVDCVTQVQKCDFHFALSGNALTCSALSCKFDDNKVECGYTKCSCDGTCPIVNGVSLGYALEKLAGKSSLDCEESWAGPAKCTIDVEGLISEEGGFEARCQATECRRW